MYKAKDLNELFDVFGSFYDLQEETNKTIPCRTVLEIVKKESKSLAGINVATLYKEEPAAIFVMMNPGSSTPMSNKSALPTYQSADISTLMNCPVVPAKPDMTQYVVMNVMLITGWNRVRILNLSDIREPKSNIFFDKTIAFFNNHNNHLHSIFSPERRQELEMALGSKTTPIVAAWGQDKKLTTLATLCKEGLNGHQYKGLFTDKDELFCRHAAPTLHKAKERWLHDITAVLGKKVYVVAMSDDERYVLLKQGNSYALERNGVDPLQANWIEGNGLAVSVDVKDVSGYYQWFDPPQQYVTEKNK